MYSIKELIENNINIAIIIWYIIFIMLTIRVYFKYDKETKRGFYKRKYKELPKEYGPEVLSFFLEGKININSFSASILNLIRKGAIKLEEDKNIFFLVPSGFQVDNLTKPELYLKNIILNRIKTSGRVSLHHLKRLVKNRKFKTYFLNLYETWEESALFETSRNKFYINRRRNKNIIIFSGIGIVFSLISLVSNEISFYTKDINVILGALVIVPAAFISVYTSVARVKTKEANEDYYKWAALKRYLKTFSIKKFTGDPKLLDAYLTYSITLGESNKFIRDILQNKKEYLKLEGMNINPIFFLEIKSLDLVLRRVIRLGRKRSIISATVRRRTDDRQKAKENQIGDRGIGF